MTARPTALRAKINEVVLLRFSPWGSRGRDSISPGGICGSGAATRRAPFDSPGRPPSHPLRHLLARHLRIAPGALDRAFWERLGDALPPAVIVGIVYLALEPYFPEALPRAARLVGPAHLRQGARPARRTRPPLGRPRRAARHPRPLRREHPAGALPGPRPDAHAGFLEDALSGLAGILAHVIFSVGDSLIWVFMIAASLFFGRLVLRKAPLAAAFLWLLLFLSVHGPGESALRDDGRGSHRDGLLPGPLPDRPPRPRRRPRRLQGSLERSR